MKAAPIYLDHAATTPLDPRVLEAMHPVLTADFGNASSVHRLGRKARYIVEDARERIADLLGADPSELIFTSGGTEANNSAVRGTGASGIVSTAAEHESVLRAVEKRCASGVQGIVVRPSPNGTIGIGSVVESLDRLAPGALVSVMLVNNETGAVNRIRTIADAAHEAGAVVHSDAVQAAGYYRLDV
ncbi:MAG: aminotransferase class V-fold PLP-dependent enzyme, partial [Rhodothermales bacterium]|nr:aminotransferase class V-fold PLP-dependent enzyme [Rhodothermales bacterium]